jgi:hypothetical protein
MHARAVRANIAETCLEGAFLPDGVTASSFLINALYLFGGESIAVLDGAPEGLAAELTRLGHRVSPVPSGRGFRPGAPMGLGKDGWSPASRKTGGFDRAAMLGRTLGRGEDAEILERLRALGRSVRPGGLVCFHVFDRDRAWGLTGERGGFGNTQVTVGFDPATGRITARAGGEGRDAGCGGRSDVKAWNRAEIETLLRAAGLRLERVYGDWDGSAPDAAATGRLIVVAAKPRRARKARAG